jgi:hypothetical protein
MPGLEGFPNLDDFERVEPLPQVDIVRSCGLSALGS